MHGCPAALEEARARVPPGLPLRSVITNLSLACAEFLLRRRYYSVWAKFNFVLSAGLDAGTVCSAVFIFFTLMLPKGGTICEFARLLARALRIRMLY